MGNSVGDMQTIEQQTEEDKNYVYTNPHKFENGVLV